MRNTVTAILLLTGTYTGSTLCAQGTWSQLTDIGGPDRYWATSFALGDRVYIGCGYDLNTFLHDVWAYDTLTGNWVPRAPYPGDGSLYVTAFTIGDKGYFFGGWDIGYRNDLWEYDPANNTWTEKAPLPATGRWGAAGFAIGTKGYIGTGDNVGNGLGCQSDFWEWDQATNTWTQKPSFPGTPVYGGIGFAINGKGYIGTGYDGVNAHDEFYEWDPVTETWTQMADVGGAPRYQAFGFSIGNRGFIGAGSPGVNDLWAWDQATDTWTPATDFPGVATNVSTGAALNGKGYVGGGQTLTDEFWEYVPGCPLVAPPIDPAGTIALCSGDSVTLHAPTGVSYAWSTGESTPSITVTDAGSYLVTITDGSGCELETDPVEVTVTQVPVPTITVGDASLLCDAVADAYQWIDCANDSLPIAGATDQVYTPGGNGSFAVTITVDGCSSTSDCVDLISTGLSAQDDAEVSVHPNPFVDVLLIDLPGSAQGCTVTVHDALGREVPALVRSNDQRLMLRVDGATGLLVVRVATQQQLLGSWRVVKR
jgi:N-acetylneuraminic acid mutarotase